MREVGRFYEVGEAEVAAGFLRSLGIEVTLPEQHALGAQPELRIAFGGYRLLVEDKDYHLASVELQKVRDRHQNPKCPSCGQTSLRRERRWSLPSLMNVSFALIGTLFAAPFARGAKSFSCSECKSVFDEEELDES